MGAGLHTHGCEGSDGLYPMKRRPGPESTWMQRCTRRAVRHTRPTIRPTICVAKCPGLTAHGCNDAHSRLSGTQCLCPQQEGRGLTARECRDAHQGCQGIPTTQARCTAGSKPAAIYSDFGSKPAPLQAGCSSVHGSTNLNVGTTY